MDFLQKLPVCRTSGVGVLVPAGPTADMKQTARGCGHGWSVLGSFGNGVYVQVVCEQK